MNKKIGALLLTTLLFSIVLTTFVSAFDLSDTVTDTIDSMNDITKPITKYILGDTVSGDLLLIKFLFFIVILSLLYFAVQKVPNIGESKPLTWIISIVVSIIAIRYLSQDALIEFIWLPTGVLGITIATLLPFIIFLFFIESFDSSIIRKVGWATFAVVYTGIAMVRWDKLQSASTAPGIANFNLAWMYLAIAIISLLAIVFDKKLRAMMINRETVEIWKGKVTLQKSKLSDELAETTSAINNSNTSDRDRKVLIKKQKGLEKRIEELDKDLASK